MYETAQVAGMIAGAVMFSGWLGWYLGYLKGFYDCAKGR